MRKLIYLLLSLFVFAGCEEFDLGSLIQIGGITGDKEDSSQDGSGEDSPSDNPSGKPGWDGISAFTTAHVGHEGLSYIWDENVIPEITISVSVDEWNRLLSLYDQNNSTKEYIHCDITYKKGSEVTTVSDAGIRLRGNTSRRRPEGKGGEKHKSGNADWHHCHFGVNLRKFNKDGDHEIKGIRKFNLKWFKDDPCYARELFCYDLFRRAGVWTAAFDVYCRLWVHVEGDTSAAYYGVYEMIEPYDNKYLDKREDLFGNTDGNLWKCSYDSHGPADLSNADANMGEDNDRDDFTYELKETGADFETAKAQLQDFILKLTGKSDESFKKWIQEVCDVELFMRTYAVNVAVGMWDDHWNNGNNYYLYFNSQDKYAYKVFFIPYDYDNSLGTSNAYDAATQDPLNWGNRGMLMKRMMKIPEFKQIYIDELKRLVNPANGLMDQASATERIINWQNSIRSYVSNDTGEDMEIKDRPAEWGRIGDYRLTSTSNNYFTVKAQTINKL
jgi:spore coat protein CotH